MKDVNKFEKEANVGWGELECLLSYEHLSVKDFEHIVNIVISQGFVLYEEPFGGFTDSGDDITPPSGSTLSDFMKIISVKSCNVAAVNLIGIFFDIKAKLSICIYPHEKVVTISSRENFIWNHGNNLELSDINRLKKFLEICKLICDDLKPQFAFVGSEEVHPDEISTINAERNGFTLYNEEIFSDKNAKYLFERYLATYNNV